jgi:hypothetical protein
LYKIEYFHTLGTPRSERLKVAALNLWEASPSSFDRPLLGEPPTRPSLPLFEKSVFSYYDTASLWERERVRGNQIEIDGILTENHFLGQKRNR